MTTTNQTETLSSSSSSNNTNTIQGSFSASTTATRPVTISSQSIQQQQTIIQQTTATTTTTTTSDTTTSSSIYPEKTTTTNTSPNSPRTIDDYIEQAYDESRGGGLRWKYWFAFLALGIANSGDATEIGCLNYVLSYQEFQNDILEGGDLSRLGALLTSSVYAGMLLGGLLTGALWGDQGKYGRKTTCLCGLALNTISGICSALSPNVYIMSICRFIGGLGIGAILSSLIAFATEISPPNQRGLFVTFVASFWTLGSITVASLAYFILGEREASWRLFILTCALPAFLGIICVTLWVPESPRFLALHGHPQKALVNANYYAIAGMNFQGPPLTLEEIQFHYGTSKQKHKSNIWKVAIDNIKHLYETRELRRYHTLPLQAIWFCMSFGSGLCTWINTVFTEVGVGDVYGSALLFALSNIPGNVVSAFLLDRIGRKTMLIGSMIGSAITLWIFSFAAHGAMNDGMNHMEGVVTTAAEGAIPIHDQSTANEYDVSTNYTTLVVTSACVFHAFLVCSWCSISCMTGESFPTSIRSTGMGVCAASGRIAAMLVQFVNGTLVETPSKLLLVSSIVILIGASCPWCLNIPDLSNQPLTDKVVPKSCFSCSPDTTYKKSDGDTDIPVMIAGADEGEVV